MTRRMLIDARHPEETRVAVVQGNRIEEFDFESAERKQLKGNIYLAKVTRVEPSLQAAFIDYGGNRHGFLAFSEIHPDYYQIPREDREALLREQAEQAAEEERLRGGDDDEDEPEAAEQADDADDARPPRPQDVQVDEDSVERWDEDGGAEPDSAPAPKPEAVNSGDDNAAESLRQRRTNLRHRYKIQDVIRRRQVLLVQVVKEERGNKGAALTTYLSLAGRYCVLMPNTSHGGGISRKISNAADRKRLKTIMADLKLPSTMGCIVRTAGLQRTKTEINRDFDYLARLWDEIRETTLGASAPALVYEDSDLIKRAIRDIYNSEIDEVIVEGEQAYDQARSFMKLLMPTHARKVKLYIDHVPLFQRGGVEDQLAAMYQPVVQLKSGGYIVINPTEALVSIDINSGRSTREHNIEQTALSTNLEAAHEIARQLRLRDMAGLVVIDFIDMESNSNNRKVERAMKDALKNDRARIQVGRISSFGLFEMSRQRLRTGVLEASTHSCPHCDGTGLMRTAASAGLQALRLIEDEATRGRGSMIRLRAGQEASLYLLNRKRHELADIEARYGVHIEVAPDQEIDGARMAVESGGPPPVAPPRAIAPPLRAPEPEEPIEEEELEAEEDEPIVAEAPRAERSSQIGEAADGTPRRRRRRRRGGARSGSGDGAPEASFEEGSSETGSEVGYADDGEAAEAAPETGEPVGSDDETITGGQSSDGEPARRRSRRGRRGGRRSSTQVAGSEGESLSGEATGGDDRPSEVDAGTASEPELGLDPPASADAAPALEPVPVALDAAEPAPAPRRARRRPAARTAEAVPAEVIADAVPDAIEPSADEGADPVTGDAATDAVAAEPAPKPRRSRRTTPRAASVETTEPDATAVSTAARDDEAAEPTPAPRRRARSRKAPVEAEAPSASATADEPPAADEAEPDVTSADASGEPQSADEAAAAEPEGTPRRGWWQRTFGQ